MQRIYSKNPFPFHMYNLAKLDACSEPCQIPKVDLFAITAFNGFKCFFSQKAPSQMLDGALNSFVQNVVHNKYDDEILFSFAYAAFVFWS